MKRFSIRMRVVIGEHGAISRGVSGFSALKATTFLDAFFPFFLSEFFNADGVDVHGIWIDFGV